eukprot:jgi/Mesen1/9575/ME000065S09001
MGRLFPAMLLLIFYLTHVSAILIHKTDGAALQSLRVDFLSSGPTATWKGAYCGKYSGVRCNKAGHVTAIDVVGRGLRGTLGPAVQLLQSLALLRLSKTKLGGSIPPEVCRIRALTFLELAQNQLTGGIPECLGNLTRLTQLHLQSNRLTGHIPDGLCRLARITTLQLQRNRFYGILPYCMKTLTRLKLLDVSSNQLAGDLPIVQTETVVVRASDNYMSGAPYIRYPGGSKSCVADNCFTDRGSCPTTRQRTKAECAAFCGADTYTICGMGSEYQAGGECYLNGTTPTCLCFAGFTIGPQVNSCTEIPAPPPPRPPQTLLARVTGLVFHEETKASPYLNPGFRHASYGFTGAADGSSVNWSIASSVDWSQQNVLPPVKDQLQCGASWAFAAVGAIEGAFSISNPGAGAVSASEQQVLDCQAGSGACEGGWPGDAFNYVAAGKALATSAVYPYRGVEPFECAANLEEQGQYGITLWEQVDFYGLLGLLLAVQRQPVIVNVEGSQDSFKNYLGGLFEDPDCYANQVVDHAVLLVGYVLDTERPYLIIRNSWGASWGEGGYMRLAIAGGPGICGVAATPASYPVLAASSPCGGINPCGGGTCIPAGSSYECVCPDQFVAVSNVDGSQSCAPARPCTFAASNPCQTGTCIDDGVGSYTCICPFGYFVAELMNQQPTGSYEVQKNDTCYLIHTMFRITLDQLLALNPGLDCTPPLTPGVLLAVDNGNDTSGCNATYSVAPGDTCQSIAATFSIELLPDLNPGLDCAQLLPGQQVCVQAGAGKLGAPVCVEYAPVEANDTCQSIWLQRGLAPAQFYALNPGIYCSNLIPTEGLSLPGQQVCVGGTIQTALPCRKYYTTRRGDTCASIIYYKFHRSVALFRSMNNGFNCQTGSLYIGLNLCVPFVGGFF